MGGCCLLVYLKICYKHASIKTDNIDSQKILFLFRKIETKLPICEQQIILLTADELYCAWILEKIFDTFIMHFKHIFFFLE